jgi:hypothetical protein
LQLLEAGLAALKADDMAKIPLYEESIYTLSNKERTALGYATAGLKVSTTTTAEEDEAYHWVFVSTGVENQYYIQHVSSGMYISVAGEGARIKADATAINGALPSTSSRSPTVNLPSKATPTPMYISAPTHRAMR